MDIRPDPQNNLHQIDIDKAKAVILSNRSEAFRLLRNLQRATADAQGAVHLDPHNFRCYVRLGRISEDLGDSLRAAHYYQKANRLTYSKKLMELQRACEERVKEVEKQYGHIYDEIICKMFDFRVNYGIALPFIPFEY